MTIEKIKGEDGVLYYYDVEAHTCVDIDVPDTIETLFLGGISNKFGKFKLRDVKKVFGHVKTLHIGNNIDEIHISNYMFPNVRTVKSDSFIFESGYVLKTHTVLLNVFCLGKNEKIDLTNCMVIRDFAFEGCKSTSFVPGSTKDVMVADEMALHNSAFEEIPFTDEIHKGDFYVDKYVKKIGRVVVEINQCYDKIYMSDNCEPTINIRRGIDFQEKKTVVFHKFESMKAITMKTKDIKKIELLDVGVSCEQLICFSQDIGYKLDSFVLTERHDKLKTYNGMLCSKNGKIVFGYMTDNIKDLMIPEGVECIKPGVFAHSKVESVTFPDSLVELESNAFSRCKNLKHIEFGNGIKSVGTKFYSHIFSGCSSLKSVIFPSQVEEIGECTFVYCDKLSEIHFGKNLKYIDNYAFALCPAMKNIVLPEKISLVGVRAFDSVCKITIDDKTETLPYHLAQSFILQADISDVLSHSTTDLLQTVSVSYHDRTVIVPRYVKRQYYHEIDKNFQKMLTNDYSFFHFGTCLEQKAMTALRDLIENDSEESRRHLKRVGGKFAKVVLKSGCNDDIVVQMVKLKLFSIKTLNRLLEIAQEQNRTVLISYILAELKTNTKSFTL